MEEEKKKEKREEHSVKFGPLLRRALDEQRESIRQATYDVCESSDYEAGEIIAKKVLNLN